MHEKINEIYAYLHGLWRYRWSALLITWIVAVVGWIGVYAIPNQYQARAAVHIDTSSIMTPLLKGLAVETNAAEELNIMTRVLLSRDNMLSVIRETDMDLGINTPVEKERLVQNLASSIILRTGNPRKGPRTNIYEISYKSASPEQAYKVVSTLLNTLIENTLRTGRTDTVMAQEFLDVQILEYEKRLSAAEEKLAEFKKGNVGFMPDETGGYYARLQRAQEEIQKTKSALRLEKQRYAELRRQISGETPVLGSGGYASATAGKLRKYREELADLLSKFTEEHPDVQALRARIADLEAANAVGTDTAEVIDGGSIASNPVYQELKVQESQARIAVGRLQIMLAEQQGNLEKLQKLVDTIPQVEAELAKLNRDYEITKGRYLNLVERRESARLAHKVEQSSSEISFRVVDAPVVPLLPAGPNRPLLLAGVLVAALGAGAGWSLLMFLLYPTFIDYKQLRKTIDLPVLGSIGLHMGPEQRRHRHRQLTKYLLAMMLLFAIFGSVLWYEEPGSTLVRTLISGSGISL
jgi:polysaccharide chain length determinant protein (PEP-CTERM system associated)